MKRLDYRFGEAELWNHLKDNARMMFFELWPPIFASRNNINDVREMGPEWHCLQLLDVHT